MRRQMIEEDGAGALAGMAERGDNAAADLLTIWKRSHMAYEGIGLIVRAINLAQSNGYETGRASELLEELIAELATSYNETETQRVAAQAADYAQTLSACKLIAMNSRGKI